MRAGAPQQKKGIGRGIGIVVIVIAALVIITVAYFATRPGGFQGRKNLADTMMDRAKASGHDNPDDMLRARFQGGGGGNADNADDAE